MANLARLALSEDEAERMRAELDAILDHMEALKAVDIQNVEPTFHVLDMNSPLRKDVPDPSLHRDEVLAGAPASDAGAFCVPKILGAPG